MEMTDAVNVMLHISFNGMSNSEVEVMIEKAYNTSVHVSFQNPVKTPVKVSLSQHRNSHRTQSNANLLLEELVESLKLYVNCNMQSFEFHFAQFPTKSPIWLKIQSYVLNIV